jgi:hypothetical protein
LFKLFGVILKPPRGDSGWTDSKYNLLICGRISFYDWNEIGPKTICTQTCVDTTNLVCGIYAKLGWLVIDWRDKSSA